jgi:hypothetical protein
MALAFAALLVCLRSLSWRARLQHALVYAGLVLALLTPYLLFIQVNGGVVSYFDHAVAWAERERNRTPVVWPGLFDNPEGVSEEAKEGSGAGRAIAVVRDNYVAWMYYTEIALPLAALLVLMLSSTAFRPEWPEATAKLATVAVLAEILNAGFLRSPLEARLADPSVPHAILIAWLFVALVRLMTRRDLLRPTLRAWPLAATARIAGAVAVVPLLAIVYISVSRELYDRLDSAAVAESWSKAIERVDSIERTLDPTWPLERWIQPETPNPMRLAFYLRDCTKPSDRIFMQHYLPQVLALAQRGFAGGHADLRPGFFRTEEAQRLTIERLRHQSVPVAMLNTGDDYRNFRKSFPLISAYFDEHYVSAGERDIDGRFMVHLLVAKTAVPTGRFELLDWPCFLAPAERHRAELID